MLHKYLSAWPYNCTGMGLDDALPQEGSIRGLISFSIMNTVTGAGSEAENERLFTGKMSDCINEVLL